MNLWIATAREVCRKPDLIIDVVVVPPRPVLGCVIVLKPSMQVVPNTATTPDVLGYYDFMFTINAGFIHVNAITAATLTSGETALQYETEDRYLGGYASESVVAQAPLLPMNSLNIYYHVPWTAYRGFMMLFAPLGVLLWEDVAGNQAAHVPLVVLDSDTQAVEEYLIADIDMEVLDATADTVTIRLTRSHGSVAHTDFSDWTMVWGLDAVGGSHDPADPGNPDKEILTLGPGTYTMMVSTTYTNGVAYPVSYRQMVVVVS